ncbi:DUF695 domain-containing protein [Massilia pinisoli]|uniref:DUF695 domain-containing protein n=1 Tax=Massilia pinisoli TaxID=1772194 RepID=A0ABT1ZTF5_9BURK|nr:DUF695 domain-containing protein [Massilia pinisoli]MCS0583193.1 DUF695 domain-containing protein [Massilia pinisoli]
MTLNRLWLTANAEYEGFPIYFRRPDVKVAEFATLQSRYPRLLTVTHVLKHVKENGLPRSDYNASLESFDESLTSPFCDEVNGVIALIETFAGKRTYYIYIDPLFDADAFVRQAQDRFPGECLSYSVDEDRAWRLFRGYAADFNFS